MGKIKRGILGGVSGSVANVVGGSWKGIAYLRAKPLSVANPNSSGQQKQRSAFASAVAAARAILTEIITPFWNPIAELMSGYNRFVSQNIDAWDGLGNFDVTKFSGVIGKLTGVVGMTYNANSGTSKHDITWTDNSGSGSALAADQVVIVIFNETQNYWLTSVNNKQRGDAAESVGDTAMNAGDVCNAFLGFADASDVASNSTGIADVAA